MLHSTLGSRLKKVCILFLNGFSPANDLSLGQSDQSPSTNQIRSDHHQHKNEVSLDKGDKSSSIDTQRNWTCIHEVLLFEYVSCCCNNPEL